MGIKGIFKSTRYWKRYWRDRKIDWDASYFNTDHPHRMRIVQALADFRFKTVFEVGCGAGANLALIEKYFKGAHVGGYDINPDAIAMARKKLSPKSILDVGTASDVFVSSKGADMIISDMCYIYLDKKNLRKALKEARRVVRVGVVLCEFHSKSWLKRLAVKIFTGYNAYDYEEELKKAGFYDIRVYPLTEEDWPGTGKEKLRCIISAR